MTPSPLPPATAKLVPPSMDRMNECFADNSRYRQPHDITRALHAILSECRPVPFIPDCPRCNEPMELVTPYGAAGPHWQCEDKCEETFPYPLDSPAAAPPAAPAQARPEAERPVDPAATITLGELAKIIGDMLGDNPATNAALRQVHDRSVDLVRGRSEVDGEGAFDAESIFSGKRLSDRDKEELAEYVYIAKAQARQEVEAAFQQRISEVRIRWCQRTEGEPESRRCLMLSFVRDLNELDAVAAAGGERDGGK